MRLPKHTLKKNASSHKKQAKHSPKKLNKIIRKQEKENKKSEMAVEDENNNAADDVEMETGADAELARAQQVIAKHTAKVERKKQNAHKVLYKKTNTSMSNKHGPRAVSR